MTDRDVISTLRETIVGRRISQFAVVGMLGTLCDYTVLIALVEIWGARLEVAKVIGAETAIVVMFVVNERWTFARWGDGGRRALGRRLVRSNVVRIGGLVVAVLTLSVLVRTLGVPYPVANAVGIGLGGIVNYLAENLFTWRVHRK